MPPSPHVSPGRTGDVLASLSPRKLSAKSATGLISVPPSCPSDDGAVSDEDEVNDFPTTDEVEAHAVDSPEATRRRAVAKAMAAAAAKEEARLAAVKRSLKEARAAAARRAFNRIRGTCEAETSPRVKRSSPGKSNAAASLKESNAETKGVSYLSFVKGIGMRRDVSGDAEVEDGDEVVGVSGQSGDDLGIDKKQADADALASATKRLWGGLWENVKSDQKRHEGKGSQKPTSAMIRRELYITHQVPIHSATQEAKHVASNAAHLAQVETAKKTEAGGICGWDVSDDFMTEPHTKIPHQEPMDSTSRSPSFHRDWRKVRAKVVTRRAADDGE